MDDDNLHHFCSKQALEHLERCIDDIWKGMKSYFLKLLDSKTKLLILSTLKDVGKLPRITVGNEPIFPSGSASNIGAYMD